MRASEEHGWKRLTQPFSADLHQVLQQQHHAVQFIALAGRHLIPGKPDDSNTSMQFLPDREWFIGNGSSGMVHRE